MVPVVPAVPVLPMALTMPKRLLALLSLSVVVAGCASTPPLNMEGADTTLTPGQVAANPEAMRGRRVAWGGTIVATHNLKDTSEVEVLGYPLQASGRPDTGADAQHRFLVVRSGYLESADYRAGRLISAVGVLAGSRSGRIGDAPYTYPVLQADELYLWPREASGRSGSNVHFGVGIGVIIH
jgi:outer membrane lipoprotein